MRSTLTWKRQSEGTQRPIVFISTDGKSLVAHELTGRTKHRLISSTSDLMRYHDCAVMAEAQVGEIIKAMSGRIAGLQAESLKGRLRSLILPNGTRVGHYPRVDTLETALMWRDFCDEIGYSGTPFQVSKSIFRTHQPETLNFDLMYPFGTDEPIFDAPRSHVYRQGMWSNVKMIDIKGAYVWAMQWLPLRSRSISERGTWQYVNRAEIKGHEWFGWMRRDETTTGNPGAMVSLGYVPNAEWLWHVLEMRRSSDYPQMAKLATSMTWSIFAHSGKRYIHDIGPRGERLTTSPLRWSDGARRTHGVALDIMARVRAQMVNTLDYRKVLAEHVDGAIVEADHQVPAGWSVKWFGECDIVSPTCYRWRPDAASNWTYCVSGASREDDKRESFDFARRSMFINSPQRKVAQ
jgi:hypothetical protein